MVATEPTPARDPSKGALHHPSSGQGTEPFREELVPRDRFAFGNQQAPFGHGERFDGLHHPTQVHLHPQAELPSIVAISPHQLHSGEAFLQRQEQGPASFLIGALRSRHLDGQQMALRINQDVALAPPDFFYVGKLGLTSR